MQRKLLAGAALVVLVIALLAVRLTRGSEEPAAADARPAADAVAVPAPATTENPPVLPFGSDSPYVPADPDGYAQTVAEIVFGMDPGVLVRESYRAMLLRLADPDLSGTRLSELERAVDRRIPSATAWAGLRARQQRSDWTNRLVWEPSSRVEAVLGGGGEPGLVLRNVTGEQTTRYVEDGREKVTSRPQTITIGMRCPTPGAETERCRLVLIAATVAP